MPDSPIASRPDRAFLRRALLFACLPAFGCGSDKVLSVLDGSHSLSAQVGQEITVTLGNVGPGTYASPPDISGSALTYLGVEVVPPFTPAGPNQRFRFSAVMAGDAIVVFRRSLNDQSLGTVQDTVHVR